MRLRRQATQRGAAGFVHQVDMHRSLATAGVGDGRDVGQRGRVDQHHLGAISRQRAPGHRPGQDACQLQHPQAGQRLRAITQRGPGQGGGRLAGGLDAADAHQRLRGQHLALRVGVPLLEAAGRGHHQAGIGGLGLEGFGAPAAQRLLHRVAPGGVTRRQAQQPQRAVAVVREVGMDAHPARFAIGPAGVQARHRVPGRQLATVDQEVGAAVQRGMGAVHRHPLALADAAAQVPQLCRRQRRRAQGRLRGRGHGKRGGQHRRIAGDIGAGQCRFRQAGRAPQRLQRPCRRCLTAHASAPVLSAPCARALRPGSRRGWACRPARRRGRGSAP